MNAELHSDPSLGHKKKGSKEMAEKPKVESPKGAKNMEKKEKAPYHMTHITHHDDGSHSVGHEHHMKGSQSGAFIGREPAETYSAGTGKELMSKLSKHLGIGAAKAAGSQEAEVEPSGHEPPHERDEAEEELSEGE